MSILKYFSHETTVPGLPSFEDTELRAKEPIGMCSSTSRVKKSIQREGSILSGRTVNEQKSVGVLASMVWLKLFAIMRRSLSVKSQKVLCADSRISTALP